MLSENVPVSLLIAETRWPGVTLKFCIQFAGRTVPAVRLTALPVTSMIAMRQPPVDETEPG